MKRDYPSGRPPERGPFRVPLQPLAAVGVVEDHFMTGVRGQETVRLNLEFGGIVCTAEEDMARQEYALSSDLSYQIQRFGVGVHPGKFGVQDFDLMDLTTAMAVIEDSQRRWLELPRVIRDRYQSWSNVEKAHASGELAQLLKTAGAEAASASAPAVSASDSAAGTPPKAG